MATRFKPRRRDFQMKVPVIFKDQPFEVPVNHPKKTYTPNDFHARIGEWLDFATPWGTHRGLVEDVKNDAVLIKMPVKSIPNAWASHLKAEHPDFQLAGLPGVDGCQPLGCWTRGPWCWFWFPIFVIIFIFPFFCW